MKYRPEIDGLRAVSVLAVFLFHLGWKPAAGGYVGVDVFFVISGYLITTLIYTEYQSDRFSLASFYVRRIKRIAPALLMVVLLTVAAGYTILLPGDYDYLARSGLYAIAGISNFFFLTHTGYFDAGAETMPLLHTWSLGVEEQFYVIWPTLLLVLFRLSEKRKFPVLASILILIVASLAIYLLTLRINPKVAFFMPHTRAWELFLGGTVLFIPETTSRLLSYIKRLLPWLGLALIGVAIVRSGPEGALSGYNVIASVFGAYLVIFGTRTNSILGFILASRPFTFVGKISYSLYLFHFPMIVFWRYYAGESVVPAQYYVLFIAGGIVLSALSWRYIEQPCRRTQLSSKKMFSAFIAGELAMACLCGAIVATQGAAQRIPASVQAMRSLEVMWDWPCAENHIINGIYFCGAGAPWSTAKAHAVIWGDSNAAHFMPFLEAMGKEENVSVSLLGTCSPIVGSDNIKLLVEGSPKFIEQCDQLAEYAFKAVKDNKDISLVILSAAWASGTVALYKNTGDSLSEASGLPLLKEGLNHLLPQIEQEGRTIVIMSEVPKWAEDPIPCVVTLEAPLLRSASFRDTCRDKVQRLDRAFFETYQKRTDDVLRSFNGKDGVVVWSPTDHLCNDQSCATMINGEFIYRDPGHLRRNLTEQTTIQLSHLLQFDKLLALAKRPGIAQ